MAVNELDRDYLTLVHHCDMISNIMNGRKMDGATIEEKKGQVGNIVNIVEMELLDDKYETAGKDLSGINATLAAARIYWQGDD